MTYTYYKHSDKLAIQCCDINSDYNTTNATTKTGVISSIKKLEAFLQVLNFVDNVVTHEIVNR